MKFKNVIGIDVSKNTIDVYDHLAKQHDQFTNSNKGVKNFLKWVESLNNSLSETLFVYEHTGMYSHIITEYLSSKKLCYFVAPALDIKRSMGITRGKDDVVDAKRIALYGFRLRDEIIPTKSHSNHITKLKSLMSLKAKLIKQRASFKVTLNEQKNIYKVKDFQAIYTVQEKMIHYISKQIKAIESEINSIIENQEDLIPIRN